MYDWTEDYPEDNGSIITKNPRFRSWFNNLLVSSSHSGQFHSALMVGDGIRTTLTPLTFSKPRFDGIQWDLMTDKYALTMLSSRISNTGEISSSEIGGGVQANTFTALMAAKGRVQVGDFAALGATFVNAAHRNSNLPFGDNSLSGLLSGPMNTDFVRSIVVRISDDSPEDGEGGALLSRWRIFINGVEHTQRHCRRGRRWHSPRRRDCGQWHGCDHADVQHRRLLPEHGRTPSTISARSSALRSASCWPTTTRWK